ncbi:hypothetical protein KSP39_PZI017553 [Platanthera zijinensis]|uniref:Reverse transcriptase domain-containing protein n=1 Tax=Platanthera zijinensis TaxID=2320716 RepID=A0AAP0G0A1_9ASPA
MLTHPTEGNPDQGLGVRANQALYELERNQNSHPPAGIMGASKLASHAYLKELVRKHHPIAVFLLETRKHSLTRREADRLIGRHWSFEIISSRKIRRRRLIWEDLSKLDLTIPTIIDGDFNCVLRPNEKRGGSGVNLNKGPHEFTDFITVCGLHEVPYTWNAYTWCNNRDPHARVLSRLDRILLNSPALLDFPDSIVHHLPLIGSDHAPLFLEVDKLKFSSHGRLKFEEAWMILPNTHVIAFAAWRKAAAGPPSKILADKCGWCLDDTTSQDNLPPPPKMVNDDDAQHLLSPPSDAEIKAAVFSFGRNKSQDFDGVTHSFFASFWGFTMAEIVDVVKDFFANDCMETSWKDTLVMLIPKSEQPCLPEHYRPISLCSSIYKMVAKIIANRMKPLIRNFISEEQAAFVPGRLLSNHCTLAHEIMHRLHTTESKDGFMAIKLDMEKAFDRIQWSFVRRALQAFNFPIGWINLILECISNPRYGLLINGVRASWINATCGLRQGCPLSPYLFIICSEFLSLLIKINHHPVLGIKLSTSASKISHLLFADDTLLFGTATTGTVKCFSSVINDYCSYSGEAINPTKSSILFGLKVLPASKDQILLELGHKNVKALSYLGIKLRPGRAWTIDYDALLTKLSSRIRKFLMERVKQQRRYALCKLGEHLRTEGDGRIGYKKYGAMTAYFNGTGDGSRLDFCRKPACLHSWQQIWQDSFSHSWQQI